MSSQTTWMYPNRVYVASGGACANSLLFEDKRCHLPAGRKSSILQAGELFFKYLKRFVSPMARILHYKLNSTEWALLIHTKCKEEIRAAYLSQRERSERVDRGKDLVDEHRMLSEHFRMFLSQFAKECNYHLQRKGVIVMKTFDKYLVSTEMDYYQEFQRLCDLKFCSYQQIKVKYQPDESKYDEDKLLVDEKEQPHVLRSASGVYLGKVSKFRVPILLNIVPPKSHVLRKILNQKKTDQNSNKPPPNFKN